MSTSTTTSPDRAGLLRVEVPTLPALVVGAVHHVRHRPIRHVFSYRHYHWLIDLDAPARLPRWLAPWSVIHAEDHLDGPNDLKALKRQVLERLSAAGVEVDDVHRVLLQAHARILGHVFDPMSVFWCLDADDCLSGALVEVHNTYGRRHAYVVVPDQRGDATIDKAFFVSPFNEVSGQYRLRFRLSRDRISTVVALQVDGEPLLTATVTGLPTPLTSRALTRVALRHPLMTQQVSGLIRAQGIYLWARRLPLYTGAPGGPKAIDRTTTDPTPDAPRRRPPRVGPSGALAQLLVHRMLADLPVRLRYPDGTSVGTADPAAPVAELHRPAEVYRRLQAHPKIGLGEGYVAGDWGAGDGVDLADFLAPFAARLDRLLPRPALALRRVVDQSLPHTQRNTPDGARSNVSAHYDLGNDLFAAFLDETMTYSAALFARDDPAAMAAEDLPTAQRRKIDAALDRAGVGPGTRLLEVGTGWGELALRAAQRGARVTTLTLSTQQAAWARRRVQEAGLADRVEVRLEDYRQMRGEFDAVVSIEMIEAVGEEYWPQFFTCIERLLVPGGVAIIQSILMDHHRLRATHNSYGWIQKHVFPGGLIPSLQAIDEVTREHTRLRIGQVSRFGPHYAHTLRRWRAAFIERWPGLVSHGYDERFRRTWEFYLAYCEAGFAAGYLDVAQITLRRIR